MTPGRRASRGGTALAAVLLLAWVVYFVAPGLQPGRTLLGTDMLGQYPPWSQAKPPGWEASNRLLFDQANLFFPLRTLTRALAHQGLPPLWNPFSAAGSPLLANYQSEPFAPVQMIVSGLPWTVAPAVAAALHLAVAALGMLLFLRALGASRPAALFGALAFAGSGVISVLLYHPVSDVSCWFPLAACLALRLARRGDGATGGLLALVLGAQYLGGHPETSAFVACGTVAVFVIGRALRNAAEPGTASAAQAVSTFIVAHLAGLLLAGVQILPFLEYLNQSSLMGERTGMQFHVLPQAAVGLVAPLIYGSPVRPFTYFGPGFYNDVALQYAGLATLVFALAGILAWALRRRGDEGWTLPFRIAWIPATAACAAATLLLLYPTPLWWLVGRIPAFSIMISASGLMLLYCFGVAVLGALALDMVGGTGPGGDEPAGTRRALAILTLVVAIAAATALVAGLALPLFREPLVAYGERLLRARYRFGQYSQPLESLLPRVPLALAAVRQALLVAGGAGAALAILLGLRRRLPAGVFAALAAIILVMDTTHFGRGYVPAIPATEAVPGGRGPDVLQRADVARVLPTGRAYPPNSLVLWGVEDFRSYDAIGTAAHARYNPEVVSTPSLRRRFAGYRRELVNAAGVDVVVAEEPIDAPDLAPLQDSANVAGALPSLHVYRNLAAWPRLFLVEEARRAANDEEAVARAAAAAARLLKDPGGMSYGFPGVVASSPAQSGRGVAWPAAWSLVEGIYPGLRQEAGSGRDRGDDTDGDPGWRPGQWIGDPGTARRRLCRSETVYRVQDSLLVPAGHVARGALRLDGTVTAPRPAWFVVLDQDYPGWEVTVDGIRAEPLRAYGLFRAVRLDAGRHEVRWSYRPASFAGGLGLSLATLLGVGLWVGLSLVQRPQASRSSAAVPASAAPSPSATPGP